MPTGERPPRLAIVYDADSFGPLEIADAAGGAWQTVWVIDRRSLPDAGTLTRLLRRIGDVVDTTGLGAERAAAAIGAARVDGIITFSDEQLAATAELAATLGLPHHSPTTARLLTHKGAQRSALQAAGIAVPEHWAVPQDSGQWPELCRRVRYPAVVKPQFGRGSRHTYLVRDSAELNSTLEQLRDRSADDEAGDAGDMVVEEYIADSWNRADRPIADFVSVESVASRGRLRTIAVTGKLPLSEPFRETGDFIPSDLDPATSASVADLAGLGARALGVTVGALHTEIKLTPEGPRIIEINGRVGGGGIPEAIERVSGYSLLRAAGLAALGHPVADGPPPATNGVAFSYFLQPPMTARTVERVEGVDALTGLDGVLDVTLNRRAGSPLDWRNGFDDHIVAVRGATRSHAAVHEVIAAIKATVSVGYG